MIAWEPFHVKSDIEVIVLHESEMDAFTTIIAIHDILFLALGVYFFFFKIETIVEFIYSKSCCTIEKRKYRHYSIRILASFVLTVFFLLE